MIEVKLTFPDAAALVAFFNSHHAVLPSAAVTVEKQEAARASTAAGKAPKVEAPKVEAPKVEAPKVEAPKVEAPKVEAPKVEAPKVEAPKVEPRKYESSGIPEKISHAVAKNRPAVIDLLVKHKALSPEGKPNGKFLAPEAFDAFEADIDALLAANGD